MCRAEEKMKLMAEVLAQAQENNYDTTIMVKKLRAMLQSAEENARMLKKQSTFLSQLAAKTIPKGLHCFSMRLTVEYHMLPLDQRDFPHQERLEDPSLYHYALFSDNILAASVVVNSAVSNAKVCSWCSYLSLFSFFVQIVLSWLITQRFQNMCISFLTQAVGWWA